MSNNTHAPGPWQVKWERNSVYIRSSNPDRDLSICRVMTHRNCNNLDLLVSAPELLETCERLLGFALHYGDPCALEAGNGLIQTAKQTIAKAKGEQYA